MDWILYSSLMYIFSVSLYLVLRKLQKREVPNDISNLMMFLFGSISFAVLALINKESLKLDLQNLFIIIVATYLFSYLGNKFSFEGIKHADNPGLSLIIQKSYAIYTTIAAFLIFGSEITLKNLIAILIVINFLTLILNNKDKIKFKANKSLQYSLLAFFAFGSLVLTSKWLQDRGVDAFTRTAYIQFIGTLLFIFDLSFKIQSKPEFRNYLFDKTNYIWFLAIGLSNALFNLFMQYAFETAPNIGYVNIINAASIAAISILAAMIYKEKLNTKKIIGIIGVTGGITLLFI